MDCFMLVNGGCMKVDDGGNFLNSYTKVHINNFAYSMVTIVLPYRVIIQTGLWFLAL